MRFGEILLMRATVVLFVAILLTGSRAPVLAAERSTEQLYKDLAKLSEAERARRLEDGAHREAGIQ